MYNKIKSQIEVCSKGSQLKSKVHVFLIEKYKQKVTN
jgi:hypothetical protein